MLHTLLPTVCGIETWINMPGCRVEGKFAEEHSSLCSVKKRGPCWHEASFHMLEISSHYVQPISSGDSCARALIY